MSVKRSWKAFARARPGRRFSAYYERQRRKRHSALVKALWWVAGVVLVLAGAFLLVFPGPGLPVVAAGGALIASRSRPAARVMDWLELKLRRVRSWALGKLRRRRGGRRR